MDIVDAMSVISAVLGNKNVEKRFNLATDDVREGQSITTAMTKYNLFPTILIQMVSVGEKPAASTKYFYNRVPILTIRRKRCSLG